MDYKFGDLVTVKDVNPYQGYKGVVKGSQTRKDGIVEYTVELENVPDVDMFFTEANLLPANGK